MGSTRRNVPSSTLLIPEVIRVHVRGESPTFINSAVCKKHHDEIIHKHIQYKLCDNQGQLFPNRNFDGHSTCVIVVSFKACPTIIIDDEYIHTCMPVCLSILKCPSDCVVHVQSHMSCCVPYSLYSPAHTAHDLLCPLTTQC